MTSRILRWSTTTLFVLVLLIVLAIAGLRLAAAMRETGMRRELAPPAGHLVPTNSGGVFVQEKGPAEGIPVVLFHGTAAWSELWRRTTDALAAAGFHVIALDLPPFGFSDRPGGYTRQEQAARVNDVLGQLQRRARDHCRPFLRRGGRDRTRDAPSGARPRIGAGRCRAGTDGTAFRSAVGAFNLGGSAKPWYR